MTKDSAQVWKSGRGLIKSATGVGVLRLAKLLPFAAALVFCSFVCGQEPLSPARNEVRVFGGYVGTLRFYFWSPEEENPTGPAVGVAFSHRLSKRWDLTGSYVFNSVGSDTFHNGARASYQTHEFTGGVRLWLRSRDRVAPYLTASGGGLSSRRRYRSPEGASDTRFRSSPGGGLGVGVSFPIGSKQGLIAEVDLVVSTKDGHARVSGGWYRRF